MLAKQYVAQDVYTAALERLEYVFTRFEKVYLSFSGGKDSSVMVQLAIQVADKLNKLPLSVLFIDLEAQYKLTIEHVREIMSLPEVEPYWVCLPIHLRNAVSMYQPQWVCWNPDKRDKWVREFPQVPGVITDCSFFSFYRYGMEFEEFVVEFGKWFAGDALTACGVAIRADESLNRFRTLRNERKGRYNELFWTTKIGERLYNFYPLYDWRTEDIWTCVGKNNLRYNKLYDLLYMQGQSIHKMRICQPYGDDQRASLNLFRQIEPETWFKIVDRVSGANYGNIYCNSFLLGNRKLILPEGHTWKSYVQFLLDTLPRHEAEWYKIKIDKFFAWWEKHGYPRDRVPDFADPHLESMKKVPSWRRVAKVILKNDKLCKGLSFGQTKNQYAKYLELKEMYGE